jgi:serine protease
MQNDRHSIRRTGSHEAIVTVGNAGSRLSRRLLTGVACFALSLALTACGGGGEQNASSETSLNAVSDAAVAEAASAASSSTVSMKTALTMNSTSLSSDASVDRFIIRYKAGTAERDASSAVQSKLDRLSRAFPAKARHLRRMGIGADVVTTERKLSAAEARAFMRAVASDPNVDYIEPDTEMSGTFAPNDPEYRSQWGLESNQKPGTTMVGIRAESAWDIANGSGTVIAVVDNGVTGHSDLNPNVLPGYDFTANNRSGNGTNPGRITETCEVLWHGTHVAGIAGAVTNNGVGIAGVAPATRIVPVRVLNACARGYTSDIADGMIWAAGGSIPGVPDNPNPAKVINVSLGGLGSCETTFQTAIDYATGRGAVVVAAAGNYGVDASNFEPANCRNVVNVGGTNRLGWRWVDSDFGLNVDIAAPADSIWSTYNNGTSTPGPESYGYMTGTSMAAPMVSGVIALAQSVAPRSLSPAEMRTLLTQNVQPFPNGQPDQPIGPGILDANATVKAAKSGKIPAAADFTCTQSTVIMQVTCTDRSTARGAPITTWAWNFGLGAADTIRTQSVNAWTNYDYPGTYPITFKVTDSTGAVSKLTRSFRVLPPTLTDLIAGVPITFSAKNAATLNYDLVVPAGVKRLTFTLSPTASSETAILDIRAGTPSMLHPDCESIMVRGGGATCTISNPAPGTYYAIVSANTKLSNVSLLASYTQ